jgi:outer membrane lipoprotein-sorting protein
MRIFIAISILIIIFGFSPCEAGQIAGPPIPLKLPDDVSWVNTILTTREDGSRDYQRHVFVAKGNRWRLEFETFNSAPIIFVFNGSKLGTNSKIHQSKDLKDKTPDFWDARTHIRMGYETANKSQYKGIKKIDNKDCWHFSSEDTDSKFNLWVDVKKRIPRRMSVEKADGGSIRDLFDDIPKHIKITPDLFNVNNLKVILLAK